MTATRTRSGLSPTLLDELAHGDPAPSPPRYTDWAKMLMQDFDTAEPIEYQLYQHLTPRERDRYNLKRLHTHGQITALLTPQMKCAQKELVQTITAVNTNHSPVAHHGLFLTGPAHVGKSTILISFAQALEQDLREAKGLPIVDPERIPRDHRGNLYIPVAYVLCTSHAGGTLTNILNFYGEHAGNMRIAEMAARASFLIQTCGTRVLILDQAQELSSNRANMDAQSEFLKSLLDTNLGLTILGAGIDLPNLPLFQINQSPKMRQSALRFLLHEVRPYPSQGIAELTPLLNAIEQRLILLKHPPGSLAKHADEALRLTGGITGLIVRLICDAAALAIEDGEERITIKHLRRASRLPRRQLKALS